MNIMDAVNVIESGDADWEEYCEAFQCLIDSGTVWALQGSYGRQAMVLLQEGYCHAPQQATA